MSEAVAVIGAGAWGTALACVCARNGYQTRLWGRDPSIIDAINNRHENPRYLAGISLPDGLEATGEMETVLAEAKIVLMVTPAQSIEHVAVQVKPHLKPGIPIVLCAKGINRDTGRLPAQTVEQILPDQPLSALSGPSFASDVARNLPTAVTLATNDTQSATELAHQLSGPAFRVYASDDLVGVELGGALKNVIALAVGVCRGMQLGASAEAALIARGFAELSRLAIALGARSETLMGLSGLGDLVLTCSSPQSRNFSYGMELSKSAGVSDMPNDMLLAEGALTASIAQSLAKKHSIDAPVINTVAQLIEGTITAKEALTGLLARPLKSE